MSKKKKILLALVFILLIALATAFIGFRKDLAAANKKISAIHSQVYKYKNGNIEYVLSGEGPVILVSHGITGGVDQGMGLAGMYLGAGYRMLYVSRFGYLRSSMPGAPSAKLQADAYKELLDFLGIDSVFVLGNSAGGPSAIRFAIGYPEKCKALILISSAVPQAKAALPPKPVAEAVFGSDFIYWCAIKLFGKSMSKMFVPGSVWKSLSKAERKDLIDDIYLSGLPISSRTQGVLFDMYISNLSMNDEIPYDKIKSPTLIIHARDDPGPPIAGAQKIAARIANNELVIFARGGHLILGHEGEIKKRIREFILKNQGQKNI
jgi:pimeloyl-ACP methyl ester carboxylesterase